MKKVYVCSAYAGNKEENIRKAIGYSREIYKQGHLPICVHIYLEKATGLSEENGERGVLLDLGREFVKICDELWVFGTYITEGMKGEINVAEELGIKVRRFKIE